MKSPCRGLKSGLAGCDSEASLIATAIPVRCRAANSAEVIEFEKRPHQPASDERLSEIAAAVPEHGTGCNLRFLRLAQAEIALAIPRNRKASSRFFTAFYADTRLPTPSRLSFPTAPAMAATASICALLFRPRCRRPPP